jgi:hypothetical protein
VRWHFIQSSDNGMNALEGNYTYTMLLRAFHDLLLQPILIA